MPSTNNYFFVIVLAPYQTAKSELSLVRRFQYEIVCHQRSNTGEAIEVLLSPKVGVNGRIIVIFTKIELFEIVFIYFLCPSKSFLGDSFFLGVWQRLHWKTPVALGLLVFEKYNRSTFSCPFSHTYPLFCTLGQDFDSVFWS